ncbi:hypothetical protein HMPREF1864_00229 [Peptoniphilus sp. DNF00840]|nr:hypothetical protein HMPREF1864_00229 [Peptoniphilus sp. DNF00840]
MFFKTFFNLKLLFKTISSFIKIETNSKNIGLILKTLSSYKVFKSNNFS